MGLLNMSIIEIEMPASPSITLMSGIVFTTSGGTSLTIQLKVSVAAAPLSSLAVTVTM